MSISWIKLYTAAFLIVVVVFPCVSADDDLVSLRTLTINDTDDDGMHAVPRTPGLGIELQLDRMLEEHDTFQVTTLYLFAFVLSFCAVVCSFAVSTFRRELPAYGGRAPPIAF